MDIVMDNTIIIVIMVMKHLEQLLRLITPWELLKTQAVRKLAKPWREQIDNLENIRPAWTMWYVVDGRKRSV